MSSSKLGKNQKKVLLLLLAGVALAGARTLGKQFEVIREVAEEWRCIERDALVRAVDTLYRSKLVERRVHKDGSITLVLSEHGRKRALQYNLETMRIPKPRKWDGAWRVVVYDVPEEQRNLRIELLIKLKQLGFIELQQSVFVHPNECRDEVEYLIEAYDARQYVRRMLVTEIDDDVWLRKHFGLTRNM